MTAFIDSHWQAIKRAIAERYQETFGVNPGDFATRAQEVAGNADLWNQDAHEVLGRCMGLPKDRSDWTRDIEATGV